MTPAQSTGYASDTRRVQPVKSGVTLPFVTVRFLVSAIMAPHLRAILAFIRMSIHHLRAILPLEMEDNPHLLTIYQSSNSHTFHSLVASVSLLCNNKHRKCSIVIIRSMKHREDDTTDSTSHLDHH